MLHKLFHDFVTLFVVVNPIGTVPLFIAIAGHESSERQRQIAIQGVIVAALILLFFIVIGQPLLNALDIDLSSFQIAGGLVLLLTALRMVLEEVRVVSIDTASLRNVAIFPLGMPFLAGPAAIMAVILLTDTNVYTVWEKALTSLVMLAVLLVAYACLVGALLVQRLLGAAGTNVVSRIMGLLLAALAVQSMIGGLRQFRFS
jgi:multiple antibiotic resistance protein